MTPTDCTAVAAYFRGTRAWHSSISGATGAQHLHKNITFCFHTYKRHFKFSKCIVAHWDAVIHIHLFKSYQKTHEELNPSVNIGDDTDFGGLDWLIPSNSFIFRGIFPESKVSSYCLFCLTNKSKTPKVLNMRHKSPHSRSYKVWCFSLTIDIKDYSSIWLVDD